MKLGIATIIGIIVTILIGTSLVLAWSIGLGHVVTNFLSFSLFEASLLVMIGSYFGQKMIFSLLQSIFDIPDILEIMEDEE